MAGITDLPFRDLVERFGADLVVSEMVASQEMVQGKPGVPEKAALGIGRARTAVQIAGREARWMAEAARRIEAAGAERIDINMGCPAKKVVTGLSGSALMRDPDHALRLIEATTAAVGVEVSLKMRLGWDAGQLNAPEIARRAEIGGNCVHRRAWPDAVPVLSRARRLAGHIGGEGRRLDSGDRQRRHLFRGGRA